MRFKKAGPVLSARYQIEPFFFYTSITRHESQCYRCFPPSTHHQTKSHQSQVLSFSSDILLACCMLSAWCSSNYITPPCFFPSLSSLLCPPYLSSFLHPKTNFSLRNNKSLLFCFNYPLCNAPYCTLITHSALPQATSKHTHFLWI